MNDKTSRPDGDSSGPAVEFVSAVSILKEAYPGQFNQSNNEASIASSRRFFFLTIVICSIVSTGWFTWNHTSWSADYSFIYNTGLAGGILMLVALTYSLRKRWSVLRKAGKIESWYYIHLIGGILGPLIIIFHSSFLIKSFNSLIAVVVMLCIVCSGALGRFFYTRLSFILHSKLEKINRTEERLFNTLAKYDNELISKHLSRLTLTCLTQPRSIFHIPYAYFLVRYQAGTCYIVVGDQMAAILRQVALRSNWTQANYQAALWNEKQCLSLYIKTLMEISLSRSLEQLLNKWRLLHSPLMYILVLCTLGHIYVVHAY